MHGCHPQEQQEGNEQDMAFLTSPPHDLGYLPRLFPSAEEAGTYDDRMSLLEQCLEVIDEALCIIDGDDGLIDNLEESNRNRLLSLPYLTSSGSINVVSAISYRPHQ